LANKLDLINIKEEENRRKAEWTERRFNSEFPPTPKPRIKRQPETAAQMAPLPPPPTPPPPLPKPRRKRGDKKTPAA